MFCIYETLLICFFNELQPAYQSKLRWSHLKTLLHVLGITEFMHFMEYIFCFTYNSPAQVFGLFMRCTNLTLLYIFDLSQAKRIWCNCPKRITGNQALFAKGIVSETAYIYSVENIRLALGTVLACSLQTAAL